jgi:hypothetical protein
MMEEPRLGPDGLELLDDEGKPVEFYYSRKHRLKHASPAVRGMNGEGPPPRPKRSFLRNPPLVLMVMLMAICAFIYVIIRRYL